ncbi:hypothetical protein [Nesterenkonia ebinurensis]|uniref:hypothetical protein n=1 Tax=Nesterenkonia ebinurensis TaxID=2608252 RepID=UPI00123E2606|nr:hypothetical protein [Nesterenkonia ebinurensis]
MFTPPSVTPPHRVMIFGACREAWYAATDTQRADEALPALKQLVDAWKERGMRVLESFDDDFFLVGQPGSMQFAFFIIAEVPSLEALVDMMNVARTSSNGLRADRWFRFESRLGRRLFILDE